MHPVDLTIIAVYLLLMAMVGWWSAKKASRNAESYFLAGKSLPWWLIGVAHGSSGVDITGTMWFVMMLFIYGVKATWLLWVWPLFNVIFRMMYLGTWVRRSNVLTGAEWMRTRFGHSRGAELAYGSVVVYAIVHVIGFLSYAFRGIGEFTKPFFPWDIRDEYYAAAMLLITGVYCVVGGMYSVVMNDLIQFVLKVTAAIGIVVISIALIRPEQIMAAVPAGWDNLFFGWKLNLNWAHLMPQLNNRIYGSITQGGDGYSLFMFFTGMLLLKGVLVSMAGPTPNYAIQHILSTRSPREAALENMVMAMVSLAPRFLLIAGITVLGIVFFSADLASMGAKVNFEKILPNVLNHHVPVGLKGVLIAALLASFMSTFVSTVNSGAAYVVNDIYKRYFNPNAPPRRYVVLGWITSSAVVLLGIVFGLATKSVHGVTEWIVSALVPAFVAPNVLKWHWWRFNGYGFFAGMVAGTGAAVLKLFVTIHPVFGFLLILAISSAASFLVCVVTKPESDEVLMSFYRTVRPWGAWQPVYEKCRAEDPDFERNRDFPRDVFNIAVGLIWQTSLVTGPIYLAIQHWKELWISAAVFAVTSLILKFTWYDRLGPGDMYLTESSVALRGTSVSSVVKRLSFLFLLLSSAAVLHAESQVIRIPRITRPPKLADFLNGTPREAETIVTDFKQFDPQDGAPVSQATTAYLSYDDRNLYVAFICKDDPALIRGRIAKRKDIMVDDRVTINIDTFHDHKRAYFFDVNPYGVQMDGITTDGQGDDFSFETLWYTDAKITEDGYAVLETIPFRSMRFPDSEKQTWGVTLARFIQRNNELACWPHLSRRGLPQFVGQFGDMEGLENISPGRNLQFIPYALFSHARFLDLPAAGPAGFLTNREGRGGLDAKAIFKDALTLDTTINPDFSQVESDEPQVTVNQRYEVFYPEKRPFFTENAGLFQTPENLFFSRRIIDPQFGARLTGKIGRWSIATLFADDRAPGKLLSASDPLYEDRATDGVFRLTREFGRQSHIGALITDREFGSGFNRLASFDTRLRLAGNWTVTGQAVTSRTSNATEGSLSGEDLRVSVQTSTRNMDYRSTYTDRSPGFRSELGFIPRVDIREMKHEAGYRWRPKRGRIVSFGPSIDGLVNWDRRGRIQDWEAEPAFNLELPRLTMIRIERNEAFELFENIGFRKHETHASIQTEWLRWLAITSEYSQGAGVNYYPAAGLAPFGARERSASFGINVRPTARLRLDESYLYNRLAARETIFNNHIVRSKLNYQFSRSLSLRTIVDYNGVLPNAGLVSLERAKRINADVLLTYMVHPGTALYAGYSGAHENWRFNPLESPNLRRTAFPELATARQFFVKLSYMFRY